MIQSLELENSTACAHCGDSSLELTIEVDGKAFCCNGCATVFSILKENHLDSAYEFDADFRTKPADFDRNKFDYLDIEEVRSKLLNYEVEGTAEISLTLPQIHCSSCIYLLENLSKINSKVKFCEVNFTQKKATILFKSEMALSELALLLSSIGYPPEFTKSNAKKGNRQSLNRLMVAGFAFGNVMLWSFPEYLGMGERDADFRNFSSFLSLIVAIPALLFSAGSFLTSAYHTLRRGSFNIDVPISISLLALFISSAVSVITFNGPGYMDSFAGFVFFLLIGKMIQSRSYRALDFDRDNAEFFPLGARKIVGMKEILIPLSKIERGDVLLLKNGEVCPCDCELVSNTANFDYSFLTGEANVIEKSEGDSLLAGGKVVGNSINVRVHEVNRDSHLTKLWHRTYSGKRKNSESIPKIFTISVLAIAAFTYVTWLFIDVQYAFENALSVLIVACPCALALSRPFVFGMFQRELGNNGLYLKHPEVVEEFKGIRHIVFDKTGTLTLPEMKVSYIGKSLSKIESQLFKQGLQSSGHPISKAILKGMNLENGILEGCKFHEELGCGWEISNGGLKTSLGKWTPEERKSPQLPLKINGVKYGYFLLESSLREGLSLMFAELEDKHLHVLSGDQSNDLELLKTVLPSSATMNFSCTPEDKLKYIQELQNQGEEVMMIGDGLNDSPALRQADLGIALSENIYQFLPSCKGILEGKNLTRLPAYFKLSNSAQRVFKVSLAFSLIYNLIGIGFAVGGYLSPIVSAILMPISSISVVIISLVGARFFSKISRK